MMQIKFSSLCKVQKFKQIMSDEINEEKIKINKR